MSNSYVMLCQTTHGRILKKSMLKIAKQMLGQVV